MYVCDESKIIDYKLELLEKAHASRNALDEMTPHMDVCSNKECVGEAPICDHAKEMVRRIAEHNAFLKKLIFDYKEFCTEMGHEDIPGAPMF